MTTSPSRHSTVRAVTGFGLTFSLAVAALTGCSAITAGGSAAAASAAAASAVDAPEDVTAVIDENADQTVVADDEWSAGDAQDVVLSGSGATTDAPGLTEDDDVVTITEAGVYRLAGDLAGSVVVDAPDDAQVVLILDGVTIAADDAPAIQSTAADDVAIFLAEGSANAVSSTGAYAEDAEANAAIFSDADLTISGEGSLSVDGSANDGITSKDDLVVLAGTVDVTAADDGLRGKDSLTVRGGTITVDAGGDGLASDQEDDETQGWVLVEGGTIDITAGSDGIDGFTDAIITGGDVAIEAEEGIEAGTVAIGDGTIDIVSSDDGINGSAGSSDDTASTGAEATDETAGAEATEGVAGEDPSGFPGEDPGGVAGDPGGGMQDTGEHVLIAGGALTIDAEGDGLDSNGSMSITGGTIVVDGPSDGGNGAIDANGAFTISGGALLALDAGGMTEAPLADSEQAWLAATASGPTGATVEVVAADGTVLSSTTAEKAFGALVFSSPDVVSGDSYTITVDGSEVASAAAGEALSDGAGQMGGQGAPGGRGAPGAPGAQSWSAADAEDR